MAGNFRARIVAHGFVAKDDAGDLHFVGEAAAAMVGEARDRGCRRSRSSRARRSVLEKLARLLRAADRSRSGRGSCRQGSRAASAPRPLHLRGQRGQRRVRIIGRKELPEAREPARLFEVQVGDQQRLLLRPEERAFGVRGTSRQRTKREPCFVKPDIAAYSKTPENVAERARVVQRIVGDGAVLGGAEPVAGRAERSGGARAPFARAGHQQAQNCVTSSGQSATCPGCRIAASRRTGHWRLGAGDNRGETSPTGTWSSTASHCAQPIPHRDRPHIPAST